MGGGGSKQAIDNINNTIAKNILNSMQTVQNTSELNQYILGECSPEVIKAMADGYNKCIFRWRLDKNYKKYDIAKICSVYTDLCKMNNINMNLAVNIKDISTQKVSVEQEVQSTLSNDLQQYNSAGTNQYIKNITKIVNENVTNIIDKLQTSDITQQTITLNNVSANLISLDSSIQLIHDQLSNISSLQANISDVANIITQTSESSDNTYTIALIIIGILLFIAIMISLIMTMKRSQGIGDFFRQIAPYIVFVVIASLVLVIHLLVKPKYVTYVNTNGKTYISVQKLVPYLLLYYTILGIIIYVVTKIIKKNKTVNINGSQSITRSN